MASRRKAVSITVLVPSLLLGLGACADRSQPATPPSSTTPSPQASVDAGAAVVPLSGDDQVRFRWEVDGDPSDPAVEVAQRTMVLIDLGYHSSSWKDPGLIRQGLEALVAKDARTEVIPSGFFSHATDPRKTNEPGTIQALAARQANLPDMANQRALVFVCSNTAKMPSMFPRQHGGATFRVELTDVDGAWKVSSFDIDGKVSDAFRSRCATYGDSPSLSPSPTPETSK